ncbi:MAG: MarR family transcriptional regulator [Chloroflexota bacterium]
MVNHIQDTSTLDKATAYRIHRTARILRVHLNKTFHKLGLEISMEQWFILFRLYERAGQSQSDLADKDLNDHPNITRMIDALEKRTLVKRDADPEDRRRHLISLTEEGQALMEKMMPVIVEVRQQVFAGISQHDIDVMVATLDKIEANVASTM